MDNSIMIIIVFVCSCSSLQVNGNLVSPIHVLANAEVVEIIIYDVSTHFIYCMIYFCFISLCQFVTFKICLLIEPCLDIDAHAHNIQVATLIALFLCVYG